MPVPEIASNWRTAKKDEWVKADDGGIVQILRKTDNIKHKVDKSLVSGVYNKNGWVRTVVGCFFCKDNSVMDTDFEQHPNRYIFGKKNMSQRERLKNRENLTEREKEFVLLSLIRRYSLEEMITEYSRIFKIRKNRPEVVKEKILFLFKQERVIKMLTKDAKKLAKTIGITPEFVLKGVKNLAEFANREDVRLNALTKCGDYIEIEEREKIGGGIGGILTTGFGQVPTEIEEIPTKELLGESIAVDNIIGKSEESEGRSKEDEKNKEDEGNKENEENESKKDSKEN